jgi:hypothetical protein
MSDNKLSKYFCLFHISADYTVSNKPHRTKINYKNNLTDWANQPDSSQLTCIHEKPRSNLGWDANYLEIWRDIPWYVQKFPGTVPQITRQTLHVSRPLDCKLNYNQFRSKLCFTCSYINNPYCSNGFDITSDIYVSHCTTKLRNCSRETFPHFCQAHPLRVFVSEMSLSKTWSGLGSHVDLSV